jgi:AAA+ ATPase superfamily predicted ATPase
VNIFWKRTSELEKLDRAAGKSAFGYVTGRRRVGKTALLKEAARRCGGIYHQAVEGAVRQQLFHLTQELRESLAIFQEAVPRTWTEFFALLSRESVPPLIIFDEFPYWAQSDPSLPSVLQKWIDHQLPKIKTSVFVSGSSQSMLFSEFLNPQAPLYGRTTLRLDLRPLSFRWFCRALGYDEAQPESFERYSLTGGIPHYWRLMPKGRLLDQAERLYFEPSSILAEEPKNWLRDESITGSIHKSILDLVGNGVSKPSEIAARIGTVHGNLTRPLSMLLQLGFIQRELPFGESPRTTKKVLYSMSDPALSFHYRTYVPNRERWRTIREPDRARLIAEHASRHWEQFCRQSHPGSARYWEPGVEIDLAVETTEGGLLVAECKWRELTPGEEQAILGNLRAKFAKTRLAGKYKQVRFQTLSKKDLPRVARLQDRLP